MLSRPGEQRRAKIEAYARIVVDNPCDALLLIQNASRQIRRVAFGRYAFVPVVIRVCGILQLNLFKPRVFSRRLIEVTVNTEIIHPELAVCTRRSLCILDAKTAKLKAEAFGTIVNWLAREW